MFVLIDSTINSRDTWQVAWVLFSQVDPLRDLFIIENTPFDTLDFANEHLGLGERLATDVTTKLIEINHD